MPLHVPGSQVCRIRRTLADIQPYCMASCPPPSLNDVHMLYSARHVGLRPKQQRTGPSRVERSACTKQDDDGVCTLTFSHTAAAALTSLEEGVTLRILLQCSHAPGKGSCLPRRFIYQLCAGVPGTCITQMHSHVMQRPTMSCRFLKCWDSHSCTDRLSAGCWQSFCTSES